MKKLGLMFLLLLVPVVATAAGTGTIKNVVFYWPTWCAKSWGASGFGCPPESLALNKVTHIVHFDNSNVTSTTPFCRYMMSDSTSSTAAPSRNELLYAANSNPGGYPSNPTLWQQRLLNYCHSKNVKVMLTIVDVPGTTLATISSDSTNTDICVSAFVNFAWRFGYDGMELDWENGFGGASAANVNRFVRILRRRMDQYWGGTNTSPLMISASRFHAGTYSVAQDPYVTSYILQLYDYDQVWGGSGIGANCVWYLSPLKKGSGIPSGAECEAWYTSGMVTWAAHDKSKVGGLLPSYAKFYWGQSDTALFRAVSSQCTQVNQTWVPNFLTRGGVQRRDVARGNLPYIVGTANQNFTPPGTWNGGAGCAVTTGSAFRVTYEDSISVYDKLVYADSAGFPTIGFYDIQGGINTSATTKRAQFPMLAWITDFVGDNRQLKASSNGLYFTKQDDTPVYLNGASTWDLFAKCSDYRRLLDSMATHNINFLNARAASPTQVGGPTNVLGNNPWVGTQTFASALNEPYWLRVDSILQYAQTKNIYIAFYPDYLGFDGDQQGWGVQTASSTTAQMKAYGQALGTRYKDYWNILWVNGGDRDPTSYKAKLDSMVAGFKAAGATQLWSSRDEPATTIANHWNTTSYIDFNYSYPYWTSPQPVEQVHLFSRTMRRRVPAKPAGLTEAGYEGEHGAPVDAQAVTQLELRQQSWGGFLSGGIAYDIFGNCPMWSFGNYTGFNACTGTWQAALNSQGMINKRILGSVLNARNWWNAIPDTSGVVADSGFGTLGNSNYIPTSYTSDSSFIMSYFSTQRNLRVKLAYVKGDSVTISWINPATGAVTSGGNKARATTTLRPPSTGDWVLAADSYTIVAGPTPVISVSVGSLSAFSAITPNPSTSQNYTVSGSNLTANITVTAPTDFQVSLNNSTWSSSVTLTQSGGTVSATTVYARMNRSTAGSPSGSITHTSTGATTQNVSVSGTVTDPVITISVTSLPAFSSIVPNPSSQQSYTVSGTNLVNGNLTITAPTDFQVSLTSGANWVSAINITPSGGTVPTTTIYVRMYRTTSGSPSGGISNASPSATEKFVSVSGTATNPTITIDKSSMVFSSVVPNPSTPQSYNVSATELGGDLVISAPTDFEVSTSSGSGYTSTVSLTPTGGSITLTIIWVRMNRTTVGSPAGNLNNSSVNAVTKTIALSGTATASPPQHRRIFIYRTP